MAADAAIAAAQGLPPGINVSQMTRDERRALGLSLPISVADIINLPMDEFNDLLSKHELTEEQLTLCRDIRRRVGELLETGVQGVLNSWGQRSLI